MGKIIFEQDKCIGCGYCFSIAQENFTCNDEGRANMISDEITDDAIEASEGCPTGAISIENTCNCNHCNEECNDCEGECICEDCDCDETCDCGCQENKKISEN